ncbi:MAG: phage head-tail adapter protein [Streptococcaceae bacterium]|jgi:hypothetical protein|nr:phage head-tail adapter protein [Streptococcaceae bacterium]MCH4176192.1 phage head-tail adapter protein [Streptococcaceae bacterium]
MAAFFVERYVKTGENKLKEPIYDWQRDSESIDGWFDMLTGDEATSTNSYIAESSHIFITEDITLRVSSGCRLYNPKTDLTFEITYVDNPVEIDHHLEIYCKRVV